MTDRADGRTNCEPTNAVIEATQQTKSDRGRSGQATPVERPVSNETYTRESHKFTERKHSTGLRAIDNHGSWRAIYHACHIGVGVK